MDQQEAAVVLAVVAAVENMADIAGEEADMADIDEVARAGRMASMPSEGHRRAGMGVDCSSEAEYMFGADDSSE